MTEYITHIVTQGRYFRVAITPVSKAGASPIVATSWAEQDGYIFEADTIEAAEAFIGQMSGRFWIVSRTAITVMAVDLPGGEVSGGVPPRKMPEPGPITHKLEGPGNRKKSKR